MWEYNVYGIDNTASDTLQICENTMCMALTTETLIPCKYLTIQCVWHWHQRLRYLANMWDYNVYCIEKRDSDTSQIMRMQCVWHWQQRLRYLANMWEYNVYGIDNWDSDTSQICENAACMAFTPEIKIPCKYVSIQCVWQWQLRLIYLPMMWDYNVDGIDNRDSDTSQICENAECMAFTTETRIACKYVRKQGVWQWQQRLRFLPNMWEYNVYGIDNTASDTSQICESIMCMALTTETQITRKYVRLQCVRHWQTGLRYLANYENTMCMALTTETQIPR